MLYWGLLLQEEVYLGVVVGEPVLGVFLGLSRKLVEVFSATVAQAGAFFPRPQLPHLRLARRALLAHQPPVLCSEEEQGLLCLSPLEMQEEFLGVVEEQVGEALCLQVGNLEDHQSLEEELQRLQVEDPAQYLEDLQPLGEAVCLEEDLLHPVHLVSQVCLDKLQHHLPACLEPLPAPQPSQQGGFLEQPQALPAHCLGAQARKLPAQALSLGRLLQPQPQPPCLDNSLQPLLLQAPFSANLLLQLQDQAQYLDNPQQQLLPPLSLASQPPHPQDHCSANQQLTLLLDSKSSLQTQQEDFLVAHLSPHLGQVDFLGRQLNPLLGVFLGLLQPQAVAASLARQRSQ